MPARDWPTEPNVGAACGKLYVTGEYAVMTPGARAVLVGVDRFLIATAVPAEESFGFLRSAHFGPEGANRRKFESLPDGSLTFLTPHTPDTVTAATRVGYEIAAHRASPVQDLEIAIESNLDDPETGRKFGLGSSGAVTVAVIDAITKAHGCPLTPVELFKSAYVASARAGSLGSSGDIACSAAGGAVLYSRPEPEAIETSSDVNGLLSADWPGLILESTDWPESIAFLIGWTGRPVKTDEQLIAAGKASSGQEPSGSEYDTLAGDATAASDELWGALTGPEDVTQLIDVMGAVADMRGILRRHAAARGVVIETPLLAALAESAAMVAFSGKSSGAGGGDCGIAVGANDEEAVERVLARWREDHITPLPAGPCARRP